MVEETQSKVIYWLSLAHAVIFLASLFGNSVIIHIIRTNSSLKTTTNYLILNQAFADILIMLTHTFNMIHYSFFDSLWFGGLFGHISCKIHLVITSLVPYASVWMLVIIAVDRYFAVVRPLQLTPVRQHLKKIILFLWLWCFVCSTNDLVNGGIIKAQQYYYCDFASVFTKWVTVNIVDICFNFFLPILIIAALYTIVCLKLWSREVPGEGANQNERQAEAMKTAKNVTRMMIIIVMLFLVCWLPFVIIFTLRMLSPVKLPRVGVVNFITALTVLYNGINPFIYFIFHGKFRVELKKLMGCFFRKIRISNFVSFHSQSVELEQL